MNDGACCCDKLCGVVVAVVCFDGVPCGAFPFVSAASVGLCEYVCGGGVGGRDGIGSWMLVLLSIIMLHTLSAVLLYSLYRQLM